MLKFKRTRCGVCNSGRYRKKYEIKSKIPFTVVKCECGMVYVNPVVKNIEKLYEKDYYHGTARTGFNFTNPLKYEKETRLMHTERLSMIEKVTGLKHGRLLDIGCTFGMFVKTAGSRGWDAYGCDLSRYAADRARKIGIKNIKTGTAGTAGFRSNYFDVVTLFEVIEHIDRPLNEMKKINSLLKKGGWVVIQTGNLGSMTAKIRGKNNPYFQLGHVNYFSKHTLRRLLKESGFEIVLLKTHTEKIEPAKIALGKAKAADYARLFYYKLFEKLNISGSMVCYARKL